MIDVKNIKEKFFNNKKVAENYFFMTFLQGANLLIGVLLFPYLIRVLGKESYGTYVFIFSNIQFFSLLISFGFNFPALKKISLSPDDIEIKNRTVSEVFTAKIYLFFICLGVLLILPLFIPFVKTNFIFYLIIFSTLLVDILFPSWYFQGVQKMKFVTYVNLSFRLLSVFLIFLFVKSSADLLKYVLIISLLPVFGSFFTFFYLRIKVKIRTNFVKLTSLKPVFENALPFFWTSAFGTLKKESVTFIVGAFFSMGDVALYDLANKIIVIPRTITNSINSALFPNIIQNYNLKRIKKVIGYEKIIGLINTLIIIAIGYWAVLILGGRDMLAAYPLAVILSFTIYAWLIVGCYIEFLFVPQNRYYFVTKNQFAALVSFIIFAAISLLISKNIVFLVSAYALSHVVEIIYCRYLIRKHNLL